MKPILFKKSENLSSALSGFVFGCGMYLVLAWAAPAAFEGPARLIQTALHSIRPPATQLEAGIDSRIAGQSCTYGKRERLEMEVLVGIETSKPSSTRSSQPSWVEKAPSKYSRSIASSQEGRQSSSAPGVETRMTASGSNRAF